MKLQYGNTLLAAHFEEKNNRDHAPTWSPIVEGARERVYYYGGAYTEIRTRHGVKRERDTPL